jgi:hypothetical protein
MTIRMNGALTRCLAGSALGGLMVFAFVPAAAAQWLMPPWRAAFPGEIARSLEAQGYMLTGPLMRRPGIYLADVTAGPGGYQRLIIDARSGQILERFAAPGRVWGPALASRGEDFGEPPPPGAGGPPVSGEPPSEPGPAAPAKKSAHGGLANIHIPAAISPYDAGEAPVGARPKPKSLSTERKPSAARPAPPTFNPPLPPPAPREMAKADGSVSSAAAPPAGSSVEASEKPKVTIVPPALFQ